jgi:hypothetical protein
MQTGFKPNSSVNDNAVHITAVSLTPLCKYDTVETFDLIFSRLLLYPIKGTVS